MFVVLGHLNNRRAQPDFPAEALTLLQCLQLDWQQIQRGQPFDIQHVLSSEELSGMHRAFSHMPLLTVVNHFPHSRPENVRQLIQWVRWNKTVRDNNTTPIAVYRINL